jgi:DNA-binding XRE family transcriptional regulator
VIVLLNGFLKETASALKNEIDKAERLNRNIMKKNQANNLVSWDDHLDEKYGKAGTPARERHEEEFEKFKIGVLIQEARKQLNLTQEELALKCGTTKNYISRIENNASDIRLSTLKRIIREGLGGHLKLSVQLKR